MLTVMAALAFAPAAQAQQQAPTQHSPTTHKYGDLKDSKAPEPSAEEKASSIVTLRWNAIPIANRYLVKISRDPDMSTIFYTVNLTSREYQTPELNPGAYYYVVEGFNNDRPVGRLATQSFVVGKPLSLTGRRDPLPAPSIIAPKHMDLFPSNGYVRLAWKRVDGARGYRFRLWEEDKVRENYRYKRDTPPRWVTEVKTPWIEVHDAPYSSYMYLGDGVYRWDVAAVDKDGGYVGDPAVGYFEVSTQWFLKPSEFFLRGRYGYAPSINQSSSDTRSAFQRDFKAASHRFHLDGDWFFSRRWGVNANIGIDSFTFRGVAAEPSTSVFYTAFDFSLLSRTYLSSTPFGWTLTGSLGLALFETPFASAFNATTGGVEVHRARTFGPKFGARLGRRFDSPLELQFLASTVINVTTSLDDGVNKTYTPLNIDLAARTLYHFNNHLAATLDLNFERKRARFSPSTTKAPSEASYSGVTIALGAQINLYSEENLDNAYYPPEKHDRYYKTNTANPETSTVPSSQRWRSH